MSDTHFIEISVFPMIETEDGAFLWDNDEDQTPNKDEPDYWDIMVMRKDYEGIENHDILEEFDELTYDEANKICAQMEAKYPDAGVEWINEEPIIFYGS